MPAAFKGAAFFVRGFTDKYKSVMGGGSADERAVWKDLGDILKAVPLCDEDHTKLALAPPTDLHCKEFCLWVKPQSVSVRRFWLMRALYWWPSLAHVAMVCLVRDWAQEKSEAKKHARLVRRVLDGNGGTRVLALTPVGEVVAVKRRTKKFIAGYLMQRRREARAAARAPRAPTRNGRVVRAARPI